MIDKEVLHGLFNDSVRRSQRTNDLALRKAMDLPVEDGVQISTTHNHGNRWFQSVGSLLLAAAGGGLGVAALSGWLSPTPVLAPVPPLPAAQEYRVTFTAEDGAEIDVNGEPGQ